MKHSTSDSDHALLYESLLQLKDVDECRRFMEDLCTVTELKAMSQRIEVAMYLREGMIYQDILKRTPAAPPSVGSTGACSTAPKGIKPSCPVWMPSGRRRRHLEPRERNLPRIGRLL